MNVNLEESSYVILPRPGKECKGPKDPNNYVQVSQ